MPYGVGAAKNQNPYLWPISQLTISTSAVSLRDNGGCQMDKDHILQLVQSGSTKQGVQKAQTLAKEVMDNNGYGSTLHNACAATLSEFMNLSGINVPITLRAGNLARRIKNRGWNPIDVGDQHAGDVAVAIHDVHIFLVVQAIDHDVMLIADNQAPGPHRRKACGDPDRNHSPVAYFLRAEGAPVPAVAVAKIEVFTATPDPALFPQEDEDTQNLQEPFNDNGDPVK